MHSSTDSDRLKFCSALSAALTARVIVSQEIKSAIKEKMSRIRRAFFKNTVPFDQILFQSSYILETLEGNPAPRVLKKWFIYFSVDEIFYCLGLPPAQNVQTLKKEQLTTHFRRQSPLVTHVVTLIAWQIKSLTFVPPPAWRSRGGGELLDQYLGIGELLRV